MNLYVTAATLLFAQVQTGFFDAYCSIKCIMQSEIEEQSLCRDGMF